MKTTVHLNNSFSSLYCDARSLVQSLEIEKAESAWQRPMKVLMVVLCAVCFVSCNLLDTQGTEPTLGSGSKSFNPYESTHSGALKLSLQMFQGCAILANGTPIAKADSLPYPYPSSCPNLTSPLADPNQPPFGPIPPSAPFVIVSGQNYFLNELTLQDMSVNQQQDPSDMSAVISWMSTQSLFQKLDWSNVGIFRDEWIFQGVGFGGPAPLWVRQVEFGGANWLLNVNDDFNVELLDEGGTVRASQRYLSAELLGGSSTAGHTRVSWRMEGVLPPTFPGDVSVHLPPSNGGPPSTAIFRSTVRIDLVGSTNPFKTLTPNFTGPGVFRVTWSQLPDQPFYFPVVVENARDIPRTCYDENENLVPCQFGLDPQVHLTEPINGSYYQPNEPFSIVFDIRDQDGHRLHPKDALPSAAQFYAGDSNGLIYDNGQFRGTSLERDSESSWAIAGPIDLLRHTDGSAAPPYFSSGAQATDLADPFATARIIPGEFDWTWPTRIPYSINGPPGTYVVLLKAHRQFLGERSTKTNAFFFQVGTATPTSYPARIGNCQICHRGVLSLDNLRHGLSVNDVESCKVCHSGTGEDFFGPSNVEIHRIHFRSLKFPSAKNDCTLCHLTRESATIPTFDVCSSCHPGVHGDEYFATQFAVTGHPNRFSNCAQACHVSTPPTQHILPLN